MAMLGLVAFACAAWAGLAVVQGHYLTALIAVGATVFWLAPLRVWWIMPSVVARAVCDAEGTTIRVDRRVDILLFIGVLTGALALGAGGVLGAMNKLDIPLPPDIAPMFAMAFIGPALVFVVALVLTVKRGGVGYIRLTAEGFKFVEAFSTASGEWAQVVDVTDKAPEDMPAKNPVAMVMADGDVKMIKEPGLYSRDGRAILRFVRFYWQNIDDRVELTDGRALDRLRAVQLEEATDAA
ncbi:hypothetical protein [Mycolicibacterium neworleansense]|uniref:Transmembrane protein n=1 Tax=Mycolicibacterium neworleansense TaxID=146018 RepID=A0A0H5RR31_9MYCO|nr:hypothetical protein [Mycolicibacterium neworleansense]MCV7365698.1 hypothetical protein [Mycolicibacterium neworleansense]CRZ16398.1 hypothetical protein BN2156_03265 [Mycolicibacterium neworleansense]